MNAMTLCFRCKKYPAPIKMFDGELICGACSMIAFDKEKEKEKEKDAKTS